jgi:hypothetical protein
MARAYDGLAECALRADRRRAAMRFANCSRTLYDSLQVPPEERLRVAPAGSLGSAAARM